MILVVILICLLFYHTVEDVYLLYVQKVPPGPVSLPLIGGLYKLDPYKPHVKLQQLIQQYGEIMSFRFGTSGKRSVIIHNTKLVEKICNNLNALDRPDIPYFSLITPDGAGIGSRPYDKTWMFHTRIIRQALGKICQNSLSYKVTDTLTHLFKRFNSHGEEPRDVQFDLKLASLHIMSSVCYGLNFKEWDDETMPQLLEDHVTAMKGLSPFHPVNLFPWMKHLPFGFVNRIKAITKRKDEFHQRIFDEHVPNYTGEIHDIMDIIVEVMENGYNGTIFKDTQIKQKELKNLFMSLTCLVMAGLDTMQCVMEWCTLILASNPTVKKKMYEELQQNISMHKMVTMEMKNHLPYTEACVYEILRISSSTPLGIPHVNRTDIIADGYKIPKGTQIFTNIWHIHNSDNQWECSTKVQPERFLDKDGLPKAKSDKIFDNYMPFGRGKRTCLGAKMVQDVIFLFISNLVRTQTFELSKSIPKLIGNGDMFHSPPAFKVIFSPRIE